GRTPVFQVMFTFQNAESAAAGPTTGAEAGFGEALATEPIVVDVDAAMFDLLIMAVDSPEGLGLRFEYAAELFDEATIARWVEHLRVLLDAGLDAPERPVGALPLLDENGRRAMLAMDDWVTRTHDVTMGPIPVEQSLDVLFGRTVEQHGERLALVDGTRRWTYRELARRADRLAHHLRALGAGPECLVGICLERSAESLVAILGVLRAGAAYLPIDTVYPPDRQAFMLDDAGAPVLITQASLLDRVPDDPAYTVVLLDDALSTIPEAPAGPPEPLGEVDRLAYVIYTSGSTGKPKGVMVAHRQVVRLLRATEPHYAFSSDDVWPLFHSTAFDVSVWEIWGALLYGGRLVIVDHETSRTPDAFFALLRDERATWLNQTPSAFFQLLRCEAVLDPEQGLPDLRAVSFAGEPLDIPALRPWFERYGEGGATGDDDGPQSGGPHMINMYGITETTVHVGYRRLFTADTEPATGGAIGGPMADLRQRLLDDALQPVPIGVPGEIYVAGDGVARGYLERPGLTAERFVPDPFSETPGARLYRSGDRARFRADGDLESLGRADHQVKIRGFRIELGEIHEVLVAQDDVAEAVVIVREDTPGDPRLVGYVVPRAGVEAPSAPTLRQHLRASLPDYMVPAAFVPLERLPQTAGSKLDRRALPAPSTDRPDQEVDFVAPRDEVEQTIGAVWSEVLGLDRIGIYDSFFDLGGNSMLLVKSYGPLRQRLGESLRLVDLIRNPTILSLASHLAEGKDSAPEARPDDGAAVRGRRAGADRLRRLKQRRRSR
ncbi:MAG: amino acid adenylation domain-containing protein, partial [Acidobacteriota bacterium]